MNGQLALETKVETIKPEVESRVWDPETTRLRRWGASGRVIDFSDDGSGLVYEVEHADGAVTCYEPRELKMLEDYTYTPEERAAMLQKMRACSDSFYSQAAHAGCHALIEFTGLMNEFIKVCAEAHAAGEQFPFANTHCEVLLPFKPYHLAYLAEKLGCIYGPALVASEEARKAFIDELLGGAFKLVPVEP